MSTFAPPLRAPSVLAPLVVAGFALVVSAQGCTSDDEVAGDGSSASTCVDAYCGPSGTPCCRKGASCDDDVTGVVPCTCDGEIWRCGSGSGCEDYQCGPQGAPCCSDGSTCGGSGGAGSGSCWCGLGIWNCGGTGGWSGGGSGGTGGADGGGTDPACVDHWCGPSGAPCCATAKSCVAAEGGCTCDGTTWQCDRTLGCEDAFCGPTNAPCCEEGSLCGDGAGGAPQACECESGQWSCWETTGGYGGGNPCLEAACGPDGTPCCLAGTTCAEGPWGTGGSPATGGSTQTGSECVCDGLMWHCTGGKAEECTDVACGPGNRPCCENGAQCDVNGIGGAQNASCNCVGRIWSCSGSSGAGGT